MIQANLLFCTRHKYDSDYCGVIHSHPCYEIVYYCSGEGVVNYNGKSYNFSKDNFTVSAPNVNHIERGSKGTEVLYIGLELFGEATLPQGIFNDKEYGVSEYLEKIYNSIKNPTTYSYQLIKLYIGIIVYKILDNDGKKYNGDDYNFDNIIGYISANFKNRIKVENLAKMAGYSYDYFRKVFYERFGMTVNNYILQKRIDTANDMLKDNKFMIKRIAAECGFTSVTQFCTKYHEVMGITPKQMQLKLKYDEQHIEDDRVT